MSADKTSLKALALAVVALLAAGSDAALAQPYGRAYGRRGEPPGRERAEARREHRRESRERAYAPPPAYAYPPPAYYPAAPPAYAAPYGYVPPPSYPSNSLGPAWGQQQDEARRGVRQGGLLPLGQVMTIIRRGTPGRLLDAGLEPGPDGRPAYRVRWAASGGQRIDFIVDAASGAIIGRSGY